MHGTHTKNAAALKNVQNTLPKLTYWYYVWVMQGLIKNHLMYSLIKNQM